MKQLLAALAGPDVRMEIECIECPGEIGLNAEDVLRILFNLVANSVEAMHVEADSAKIRGSRRRNTIRITVQGGGGSSFLGRRSGTLRDRKTVVLSVRDNGPGIPALALDDIFREGYSTRSIRPADGPEGLRGVGLSIVRQLVESAGGAVRAVSSTGAGTRFDVELPILKALPDLATLEPPIGELAACGPITAAKSPARTPIQALASPPALLNPGAMPSKPQKTKG